MPDEVVLNEVQAALCETSDTDYSDLRALFINCTLKDAAPRSPTHRG